MFCFNNNITVEDRWRGGGERNRSPAVRGSGTYQPPTSDRYRPPGAREDGPPVRRQQDEFRRGNFPRKIDFFN